MTDYTFPDLCDGIASPDEFSSKQKKNNRDLLFIKELAELPFGEDIRCEAFLVYKAMGSPIKRKSNRQAMKFFCIYNAYINLNKMKDVNELARICGIHIPELSKIIKMFSYEKTGYLMKDIDITPLTYVRDFYAKTELRMDEIDKLIDFTEDILEKEGFSDEYPQAVMAGIIIYYIQMINGIALPSKFFDYVKIHETSAKKISQKVGSIYNS